MWIRCNVRETQQKGGKGQIHLANIIKNNFFNFDVQKSTLVFGYQSKTILFVKNT